MHIAQKNFYKKLLGRIGETQAEKYLKKVGYKILEKNYKTRIGEIDIIASEEGIIVFVEVKTRSTNNYGSPAQAVDKNKQKKYQRVAQEYLIKTGQTDKNCRFDVVEIENKKINLIKDAFWC